MHKSTCATPNCTRPRKTRDWCHACYEGLRSRGELPPKPCKGCSAPLPAARHYCSDDCKPRCAVDECGVIAVSRGWCTYHFTRWKLAGDPDAPLVRQPNVGLCKFDGCDYKSRKRGLCSSHYSQWKRGDGLSPLAKKSKATTCAFCGGPSGVQKGYRRVCSSRCSRMWRRHGAPLEGTFECVVCGDDFPLVVPGQRRKPFNTKMCDGCRSASAKHGYSARQLAKRDGTECKLCGEPVDMALVFPDLMRGSVDHIIPTSLGGSNEPDNVQLAHLHCNIKKNNRVEVPSMT